MTVRIQLRHDTSGNWQLVENTEVLFQGEVGLVINGTNVRMKIGNGISTWAELPYYDQQIISHIRRLPNDITFEQDVEVDGGLVVSGEIEDEDFNIDGIAKKAVQDIDGNAFTSTYQKILSKNTVIDYNTYWNTITDEGVYAVRSLYPFDDTNKNQPIGMSQNGILIVHKDTLDRIIQLYIQDNFILKVRYFDGATWGIWGNFTDGESSLVHTTGYETISGQKTFTDILRNTSGIIDLEATNVEIRKEGSTLLSQDSLGNINLGNISISGETIDGNCTKDGTGNVITETYLTNGSSLVSLAAMNDNPALVYYSNQPELYELMIEKKYSNFDMTKFTTIGSPTIEDNILIHPNDSNKVSTLSFPAIGDNDFKVGFKFNTDEILYGDGYIFNSNTSNDLSLYLGNNSITAYVGGSVVCQINTGAYALDASYRGFFERKNGVYTLWYKRVDSNMLEPETHSVTNDSATGIYPLNTTSFNIGGGNGTNCDIFLNYVSLYVNDIERFYARQKREDYIASSMTIPYTYCVNGTKIVDGSDLALVDSCFYDYKTANYFVLNESTNEEEQWFRMPYNNASGLCYKLYSWRDGFNTCEYDTDLECTQTGVCTNGTAITFKKPYVDEYIIVGVPYSNKTATGFTPTSDGYYIAKGRITLE